MPSAAREHDPGAAEVLDHHPVGFLLEEEPHAGGNFGLNALAAAQQLRLAFAASSPLPSRIACEYCRRLFADEANPKAGEHAREAACFRAFDCLQ